MSQITNDATTYEIRVQGHVDSLWEDRFTGFSIQTTFTTNGAPVTILTGEVVDQSALSGILVELSDMNLKLISVNPVAAIS